MAVRVVRAPVSVTWVVMMVVSWVSDCCGLVGAAGAEGAVVGPPFGPVLLGPPLFGPEGTPPGAVGVAPGPLGPEADGDEPPADDVPPLGPDVAEAALLGAPAVDVPLVSEALAPGPPVTLPEPVAETPGTAPDPLALGLLAPLESEGAPAMVDVVVTGIAVVEEWEPWTA
jgi:hypothetical protein